MNKGIWYRVSSVGWVIALASCGGGGGGPECTLDEDCPTGRYCAAGACTYDCAIDSQCATGYRCDPARGRCVEGCVRTNGGVEACDALDNDCDGATDEDFTRLGTACQNGGCPAGVWVCTADGTTERCTGPLPAPSDPTCDGRDEDCDGETDEDAPAQACPLQLGVCAGTYSGRVDGAYAECDYGASYTQDRDDACDRQDNDCDGATDEDALLLEPEAGAQATDGVDNNCNGLVDEPGGVMVPVLGLTGVWVDAYESTLYEEAGCTGTRYGAGVDDYPAGFPAEGDATITLYACSLPHVIPSGHLSFYRSERACQAQGKRLCSIEEWALACHGTVGLFPYGWNYAGLICNDGMSGPGQSTACGAYPGCTCRVGTYDMSGNLAEWLPGADPDHPENSFVAGFHYSRELCANGAACRDGDPAIPEDREDFIDELDCMPDDKSRASFPRSALHPYLGGRCCLDGP